jgi:abhydrolase domain-containing protein 6
MGVYPPLPRKRIEALGIDTSYYYAGQPDGPAVILLHGMSTSADSFRELMVQLADSYYLVAPDIPGFGYSANTEPYTMPHLIEWLASFAHQVGIRPAMVLGHSFGGTLATGFGLEYPGDVNGLMLLAPALLVAHSYPRWLRRLGKSLRLVDMGVAASRLWLERQIRVPFHDPAKMDESVWERRRVDYSLSRASAAAMNATAFYDIRDRLPQIGQRTALVWGKDDPVVNVKHADILAERIPRAEKYVVDRCGHVPMIECEEEVSQIIRGFLP